MDSCPLEILDLIASYCDPGGYANLYSSSKRISQAIRSHFYSNLKQFIEIKTGRDIHHAYERMKLSYFKIFIVDEPNSIKNHLMTQYCLDNKFDRVQFMTESVFPPGYTNDHALSNACMSGHLPIVEYLHKKGYLLTEGCFLAAEYNQFPVVYYLHANHCPYNSNSLSQASCYGHYEMVKWLLDHDYAGTSLAVNHAASNGNKRMIELLHSYGIRGHDVMFGARLYKRSEEFIEWLQEQGY